MFFVFRRLCLGFLVVALPSIGVITAAADETVDLTSGVKPGQSQTVRTAVEVKGDMKLNSDGKQVTTVPMLAKADVQYTERFLAIKADGTVKSARQYGVAETTFQIKNTEMKQSLRDERRLFVVQYKGDDTNLFSPQGPLTREELELVDAPGSSTILATILPNKKTAIGGEWKLSNVTLARLLGLETVTEQNVTGKLTKVEDGLAILSLDGKVTGAVGGASSEIDLKA